MSEERQAGGEPAVRPLEARDLEDVIALDRRITGRARRGYFEKRLAAALRDPAAHIQVAVADAGGVVGFVMARVLEGEFGRTEAAVALETIVVAPERQHHGIGHMLLEGLEEVMRHKGITELETQAAWSDHELLSFFDACGFTLAPRHVVGCQVSRAAIL